MATTQYTLVKVPIKELIKQKFNATVSRDKEISEEYLIAQGSSPLFDQIERLRGKSSSHINEIILVVAKKNPKQEKDLRYILDRGFTYNGIHYSRFGKSASQGKDGITAFVCDSIFNELYMITQMDIKIDECVISKYEAQRCLLFSSCTLIKDYIPNIVIIGEYEKTLQNQLIKYVVEREKEFTDKETGKAKKYKSREIEKGYKDLKISPFDGCGCHEHGFMENVSAQLGLDYNVIGTQVRLPFIKGYSVYVPFRKILKEWGYEYITDIYGTRHPISMVDCIWNISMFKGHKIFKEKYGENAWTEYMNTVRKYEFKLGISKYSHHVKHLNKYTRMNFQYLQCLDLWNQKYIDVYENKSVGDYNILDSNNDGKIVSLAKYTTTLFEKIIKGDKFYTYKFMGIMDTDGYEPESKYLEAALINDVMLKDPAVKQFIYRKLKKSIDEAKVGKIYCSGFYHTGVGDMIGYLQYAVGEEPIGCLGEREIYSGNFDCGDIISLRSPLVDPSEVNKVKIAKNDIINRWFGYFKDQDVVMFNMYDVSLPQQGGADCDGDIFLLCNEPIIIDSKIDKKIIIDIEDKTTASPKSYTKENLIEYEIMTRDNRIGEITNVATSIENKYTNNPDIQKVYDNYSSILRVMQGHEIDFIKTGTRWQMNKGLRKYLKQLPYFLLYNYPSKLKTYKTLSEKNRQIENKEDKVKLNAYHSPSPMNELCDYICTWEKKNILWDNDVNNLVDTRCLIINNDMTLSNKKIMKICRKYVNQYAAEIKQHLKLHREKSDDENRKFNMDAVVSEYRKRLLEELQIDDELIANYVIKVSYSSISISKSFAWAGYGDYIIDNLRNNTNPKRNVSIQEVPYKTNDSYEYLGKYYEFEVGDTYI
ncbi:MAG: hypothetical protein HFH72_16875 [Lachnospiraceae bacterium]|nr:hypothetical protein [Lachnospiraceae bacterium]